MSSAAPEQWFFSQNGQQRGPVSLEQLRAMLSGGQVMWTEMVWSTGMANWSPASSVAALRPLSTAPGDRPPPLPPQAIHYGGYAAPPPGPGQYHDVGADPKMRMLIPVGRSPLAIVAGYLGLLSPLLIIAPFALIVSILAIRDIKRRDTHGMGRAVFGLIMGAIFSIALCIFIVVAIVNP
jgi:hypothetical protein